MSDIPEKIVNNPTISNVANAFNGVYDHGSQFTYDLDFFNSAGVVVDHVQGASFYRNLHVDGSKVCDYYALFSANDMYDESGSIIACDLQNRKQTLVFRTPIRPSTKSLNHPSGMQVIGDYLVVGVETQTNLVLSDEFASQISFYDLSTMTVTAAPNLQTYFIDRPTKKTGAVGITQFVNSQGRSQYLLAAYDNGATDFYLSTVGWDLSQNTSGNNFGNFANIQFSQGGYSSINLLTETNTNKIYMIGFRSESNNGTYDDFADIFSLVVSANTVTATLLNSRHMYTEQGTVVGVEGVHFRYGAGITFDENNHLNFVATQRNGAFGLFHTNLFNQASSVVTVKVYFDKAKDQKSRVSDNFMLNDNREQIEWAFAGLNPALTNDDIAQIKFAVMRDKSGKDKPREQNLGLGSITAGQLDSDAPDKMYIGELSYRGKNKEDAIKMLADPSTASDAGGLHFYITSQPVNDDHLTTQ